ncbi:M48 family metalloprotease [Streptomyces lydicus]|uniref:M48 family metalloprotease n=1 Tax=Streptomyces lydicus TaxID=47763 RepID=UPI0037A64619
MVTAETGSRIDERAISAGTTMRFALLVILLLVSSGSMMSAVAGAKDNPDGFAGFGCQFAAGVDPTQGDGAVSYAGAIAHNDALQACLDRYASRPPWWADLVWPGLVLVAAGVLFWVLPAWKARRGRVVALEAVDHDGGIRRAVAELAATAGLAQVPRVVIDPTAASASAVVFGRTRRPTVCLHAGLLARRSRDPEGFRAVLLHEFAHIRNGDVTLTYVTVAVWRAFVLLVLLPYLVWCAAVIPTSLQDPLWTAEQPYAARAFVLPIFMIVLVYLARSDVLRSREVYADLAAVRWGADPRGWAVPAAAPAGGKGRRLLASFVELWRTHPRWDLRRDALTDPAALFGVQALPMFLTGAAAAMISAQATHYLAAGALISPWTHPATALLAAVAATGVAGIALWRAVAHAVLTGRRVPSGVRAGLWLGAGMAAGVLDMNEFAVAEWLPARPQVLLLVVCAGLVFAGWTTQCAHLWFTVWPGRTKLPAVLLVMAAACLLLTAWFSWWQSGGVDLASGWISTEAERRTLENIFPGPAADHRTMLYVSAVVFPGLAGLQRPLVLAAVAALWLVPLPAWTAGSVTALRRRPARGASDDLVEPAPSSTAPPPLRRVLLSAALGGVVCWVAVAATKAYLHTWQPPLGQRGGLYTFLSQAWAMVAVVTVATAAAGVASAWARRYPLLIALITAEATALAGLAGHFVLLSADGCIPPLRTLASRCYWLPTGAWPLVRMVLGPVLVSTAIGAVVAVAAVSAIQRLRRARVASPVPAPPHGSRRGRLARRVAVSVLCAAAVGTTTVAARYESRSTSQTPDKYHVALPAQVAAPAPIAAMQATAWLKFGGRELILRYAAADAALSKALLQAADAHGRLESSVFKPVCAKFGRIMRDATRYFPVPDPQAAPLWRTFLDRTQSGSRGCALAFDQGDNHRFMASMQQFHEADVTLRSVQVRLDEVRLAGAGSPATGAR